MNGSDAKKAQRVEAAAPLKEHLRALRSTLIVSLASIIAAFLLIYALAADALLAWIVEPMRARGVEIIYTALSEAMITKIKVVLIAASVAASPVVIYEMWGFVKPALYADEKRKARLLFAASLMLFLSGVAFCYFAIYTLAIDFFLIQGENLASPMLSVDKYVSFMFGFIVPFGVAFLMPVALYLTSAAGLTNHQMLGAKRKYVLLGIFVLAAVLTPPDVISQIALGVPLYLLYEVSVQVSRLAGRRAAERVRAE